MYKQTHLFHLKSHGKIKLSGFANDFKNRPMQIYYLGETK